MFIRTVQIDGVLYREHVVYGIEHLYKNSTECSTFIKVKSTINTKSKTTRHEIPINVGITFEQAEIIIMKLPFFMAVEDSYTETISELQEQTEQQALTINNLEQQTEQQLSIINNLEEQAEQQSTLVDEISSMLNDEQAVSIPQAYKEWQPNTNYEINNRRRYNDILYKCIQSHTSNEIYTPDIAISLWTRILPGQNNDEWAEWVQPDSTNPYMEGNKVTHNNKRWISNMNYNVFEPGIAGWDEYVE